MSHPTLSSNSHPHPHSLIVNPFALDNPFADLPSSNPPSNLSSNLPSTLSDHPDSNNFSSCDSTTPSSLPSSATHSLSTFLPTDIHSSPSSSSSPPPPTTTVTTTVTTTTSISTTNSLSSSLSITTGVPTSSGLASSLSLHRSSISSPSLRRLHTTAVDVSTDPLLNPLSGLNLHQPNIDTNTLTLIKQDNNNNSIDTTTTYRHTPPPPLISHQSTSLNNSISIDTPGAPSSTIAISGTPIRLPRRGPMSFSQAQLQVPSIAACPIHITVSDPTKVGDGINPFVVYKVVTKTNGEFGFKPESFVSRRYSEFLWFSQKLAVNHPGIIIPGFPEKQALGRFHDDFVEHRRVALQLFLRKCVAHPVLCKDDLLRKFLESDSLKDEVQHDKIPPLTNKSMKYTEPDSWFEERRYQLDQFESQIKSMQKSIEHLASCYRDVATSHYSLGETILMLAEIEPPQTTGRQLDKLGELHKRLRDIIYAMAQIDLGHLELALDDQLRTATSIRSSMQARINAYHLWHSLEGLLNKKLTTMKKSRFEQPQLKSEVDELNDQVRIAQSNYENITKTLRSELERVDIDKVHELSISLQSMTDTIFGHQRSIVNQWEDFLDSIKTK